MVDIGALVDEVLDHRVALVGVFVVLDVHGEERLKSLLGGDCIRVDLGGNHRLDGREVAAPGHGKLFWRQQSCKKWLCM